MDCVHTILSIVQKWGDGDSLTFNLESWSIFYEMFNRKIHSNSIEIHYTVTPELMGLRTLLVPEESGLFPAWELFFHLSFYLFVFWSFGKWSRRRAALGSGQSKWSRLICRARISARPPVGDLKRMSPRRNSWEAGGPKCYTQTGTNSWKVEESLPGFFNSSMYHWPCLNASFRTWRCNGNSESITSILYCFIYFF